MGEVFFTIIIYLSIIISFISCIMASVKVSNNTLKNLMIFSGITILIITLFFTAIFEAYKEEKLRTKDYPKYERLCDNLYKRIN